MTLPRSVQAQIDAADEIAAELAQGQEPSHYQDDTPQTLPTNPDPDPAPPSNRQEPKGENWEQRFYSLQGKYNAEVPRMASDLREMQTTVQQLMSENQQLRSTPSVEPKATPTTPLITDSDREAFGPDLIDLADRIAKQNLQAYEAREARLVATVEQLQRQVGTVDERVGLSDQDRFLNSLSKHVADWETLNVDQGFLNWLAEEDPVFGEQRQAGLNRAVGAQNAAAAAKVFQAYKATIPQPSQRSNPRSDFQRQVAPTRSRSTQRDASEGSADTRIWTQQEISDHYNDVVRRRVDPTEAEQIEKSIQAAVNEGRVR